MEKSSLRRITKFFGNVRMKAITAKFKELGVPADVIKDSIHDILHDNGYDYKETLKEAIEILVKK